MVEIVFMGGARVWSWMVGEGMGVNGFTGRYYIFTFTSLIYLKIHPLGSLSILGKEHPAFFVNSFV